MRQAIKTTFIYKNAYTSIPSCRLTLEADLCDGRTNGNNNHNHVKHPVFFANGSLGEFSPDPSLSREGGGKEQHLQVLDLLA